MLIWTYCVLHVTWLRHVTHMFWHTRFRKFISQELLNASPLQFISANMPYMSARCWWSPELKWAVLKKIVFGGWLQVRQICISITTQRFASTHFSGYTLYVSWMFWRSFEVKQAILTKIVFGAVLQFAEWTNFHISTTAECFASTSFSGYALYVS